MSGIINVSPDMRSGVVGTWPTGHVLKVHTHMFTDALAGTADPLESSQYDEITCTGGNLLIMTMAGGYVATVSGQDPSFGIKVIQDPGGGSEVTTTFYETVMRSADGTSNLYPPCCIAFHTIASTGSQTVRISRSIVTGSSAKNWDSNSAGYRVRLVTMEVKG